MSSPKLQTCDGLVFNNVVFFCFLFFYLNVMFAYTNTYVCMGRCMCACTVMSSMPMQCCGLQCSPSSAGLN